MSYLRLIIYSVLAIGFCVVFNYKRGELPPFGRLLDPAHGIWQNCESEGFVPGGSDDLAGLKAPVKVVYDERRVPHIFAENNEDLAFMQGYVTARDRLWQMEFQVMAAAGRLSEIIDNPRLWDADRTARRKGMVYAAENAVEAMHQIPELKTYLEAYVMGVNAWIDGLSCADLPLEYKLLAYEPEPWTELKTALLLKKMADNLTGRTEDMMNTNAYNLLGDSLYHQLFELFPDTVDAIIPQGTPWNFDTVQIRQPDSFVPNHLLPNVEYAMAPEHVGSNNWAVHGSKTRSGRPILCNDPHLGITFPSIWYEMQLASPDMNVYGVTLPGAPGVIIGFNEFIAWGVTNASRDVLDWYQVEFRDDSRKEYKYDGGWRKTEFKIEEIRRRGRESIFDTVAYTHHGPVVYDRSFGSNDWPVNLAMRWEAHNPSVEARTFLELNRGKSYEDYRKALTYFSCPGQNFVFASASNDIAITQQGKFPVKWKGQGEFLLDGSDPLHEWQAYIPADQNPTHKNPTRGFVSSANQHPTARDYPYDTWGIYEFYRNRRINNLLSEMSGVTVEDLKKLQNDNFNLMAEEGLEVFFRHLQVNDLTAEEKEWVEKLKNWDRMNVPDLKEPTFWEEWFWTLYRDLWGDELLGSDHPNQTPDKYRTIKILDEEPDHVMIDNVNTPGKENVRQIVTGSFQKVLPQLAEWQADNDGRDWTWQNYNNVTVRHLARIMPFSRERIAIGGNKGIVNAASRLWAPSWRMVVEMTDPPKAYGVYPGGQSGNVGSHFYENAVDPWAAGEYFELKRFPDFESGEKGAKAIHTFNPAQP